MDRRAGRRSRPSASPPTRPRSSATSCSSTCPKSGSTVAAGRVVGEIESTKSVGELFAPVNGTVVESNDAVVGDPRARQQRPVRRGLAHQGRVQRTSRRSSPTTSTRRWSGNDRHDSGTAARRAVRRPSHRHRLRRPGVHARGGRLRLGRGSRQCGRAAERSTRPRWSARASRPPPPSARRSPSCALSPRRNTRQPLDDRARLLRHDHAGGHQAQRAREPELVHGVHALPAGDLAGPPRGAHQLPDHGLRPHRA